MSPCGPMTWTGLAFTASLTEIALPKNAFWEEEYYLAHCTVGEVIALPPGFKIVIDKISGSGGEEREEGGRSGGTLEEERGGSR